MSSTEQDPLLRDFDLQRTQDNEANREDDTEPLTWRGRTASALESRPLHKAVIALISVDAACVLADLVYTFLSDECRPDAEGPVWLEVLAHISLAITTVFLIEIPLALWAFGPKYYNVVSGVPHASLHLFDAAIIMVTFVLEVVLKGREQELAGLLILLRLWRLVKLVGGIAVGAGEVDEDLSKRLAEARQQLGDRTKALTQTLDENQRLKARLALLEGDATE